MAIAIANDAAPAKTLEQYQPTMAGDQGVHSAMRNDLAEIFGPKSGSGSIKDFTQVACDCMTRVEDVATTWQEDKQARKEHPELYTSASIDVSKANSVVDRLFAQNGNIAPEQQAGLKSELASALGIRPDSEYNVWSGAVDNYRKQDMEQTYGKDDRTALKNYFDKLYNKTGGNQHQAFGEMLKGVPNLSDSEVTSTLADVREKQLGTIMQGVGIEIPPTFR